MLWYINYKKRFISIYTAFNFDVYDFRDTKGANFVASYIVHFYPSSPVPVSE